MLDSNRTWYKVEGAAPEALDTLRAILGAEPPDQYFDFLGYSNGGEGPLDIRPLNLCLDSAETVTANLTEDAFGEYFSGFVVIGGNGGGELIAFDVRENRTWELVLIDGTNIDLSESVVPIAKDFSEFMQHIGMEPDDAE